MIQRLVRLPARLLRALAARLARADVRLPVLAFVGSRAVLFAAAYIAAIGVPGRDGPGVWHLRPDNLLLDVWARWDSGFYLSIVQEGYRFLPGQQSNVAFFPLYPLLMSAVSELTGDPLLAGMLISHTCLLGALLLLYRLTALEFGPGAARRAVTLLAFFPTSFFFSAVYTESLFTLLALGVFYLARRQRWAWAGLVALLASATRIPGIVLWGVLGLAWLRHHGWTLDRLHRAAAWRGLARGLVRDAHGWLGVLLAPLGLLAHSAYLARAVGDPLAFWTVQAAWGRESLGPVAVVVREIRQLAERDLLAGAGGWTPLGDLAALFAALLLGALLWRRLGAGYALYVLLGVLIPAASGSGSLMRYALVLFPLVMLVAAWAEDEGIERTLIGASATLLGVLTALFVSGSFVA